MKRFILFVVVSVFVIGCNSSRSVQNKDQIVKKDHVQTVINESPGDTIRIANEEVGYEIIIIDSGFESWLVTQRPMWYFSQNTLEFKNYQYVIAWNERVRQPNRYNSSLYEQMIEYDPQIDYGMEVNYKLYMYFLYFQQKYNQRLL